MVSVIVNCYNSECYLKDCLDSIYSQEFTNFEIIVLNNNSTDLTESIVINYDKKDERLKYFKSQDFLNLGKARNLALSLSTGNYIAFLDSDDLWHKSFLSMQVNALINRDKIHFGYGNVVEFNDKFTENLNKKITNYNETTSPVNVYRKLIAGNFIYFSSLVISREALNYLGKFEDKYVQAEDYEFLLRLSKNYSAIQTGLVFYRLHANNTSKKQTAELHVETLEILNKHLSCTPAKIAFASRILNFFIYSYKYKNLDKYFMNIKLYKHSNLYFFMGLILYFYSIPKKIFRRIITFRISCFPKV